MQNVFEVGIVAYEAAPSMVPPSLPDKCLLVFYLFVDIVRVLVLSVPKFITSLVFLFVNRPRKNISGQLALVR